MDGRSWTVKREEFFWFFWSCLGGGIEGVFGGELRRVGEKSGDLICSAKMGVGAKKNQQKTAAKSRMT